MAHGLVIDEIIAEYPQPTIRAASAAWLARADWRRSEGFRELRHLPSITWIAPGNLAFGRVKVSDEPVSIPYGVEPPARAHGALLAAVVYWKPCYDGFSHLGRG